ncbi:sulfite exporter TauE/SafE family protein [Undibacterium arcticum]|uniref:Probable membrane transporter protein n=1 Tax=Undibacterium arcticum TaxID=1762892 RepID=A0ABV7EXG2_9BURK
MELLNPFAGFLIGLLIGLTGVGGGALMTPVLIFLLGVAPQTAVGTDLLFAAITKGVAGWMYGARGALDWLVFRRLAMGSLPAAVLTLLLIKHIRLDEGMKMVILQSLGLVLALTSVAMMFKSKLHHLGQCLRTTAPQRFKGVQPVLTVAAGALLGFLVTLTSVGAGALGAVMLVYLYPYRLTPAKLVGTDIAHAIPLTLVAGLGHLILGNIDFPLLGSLLAGSVPGVMLGSRLSTSVNDQYLRNAIAIILLIVGGRLLLQL